VAWTDAFLGGGFALAGVALQQAFAWRTAENRYSRELRDRTRQEQHFAFIELVKVARRVQRALVDLADGLDDRTIATLNREVDRLTEAVATVRLVIIDDDVVSAAEAFEERAKHLEAAGRWDDTQVLKLTPLIRALQKYEAGSATR